MLPSPRNKRIILAVLVFFILLFIYAANPPRFFPSGTIISIRDGVGLYELTEELHEARVVRSPFWFRAAAIVLGGERAMKAGEYYLPYPQSTFSIAWRIVNGDFKTQSFRITIPEGHNIKDISRLFDERFSSFDHQLFESSRLEGFLFPDTYFFSENITATATIQVLRNNFDRKIEPLLSEIESSEHTLEEIIIMASLIEGEAGGDDDRELISGILWRRLRNNIALQVDIAPETYERRGLPAKPINNPGLLSIKAALHPKTSPYLYYLHDKDGVIHYAKTFEEHKANKLKYLN
ncbi:MAG: endolytic transglycosylase MltG [Patescibacteria group bacterium]